MELFQTQTAMELRQIQLQIQKEAQKVRIALQQIAQALPVAHTKRKSGSWTWA